MKKIILLLSVIILMSGCYVRFRTPYYINYNPYGNSYRTPYYQKYPRYRNQEKVIPGKRYKPYFMPGRW